MGDARIEAVEVRWMRRLGAVGWESWVDAAAWADANGVGTTAIAARLEAPVPTVAKRLKAAGVQVGRPDVSAVKTERMLAEIRGLLPGNPQLRGGSREMRHWLSLLRNQRKRGHHREVMDVLDQIVPGWDTVPPTRQPGRTASEEDRWQKAYAAVGWTSLADGLVWAEEHNVTWKGVADHLGFAKNAVYRRAADEGVRAPQKLSQREIRVLEFARRRVESDDPWSELAPDEINELSAFLSYHRKKAADGDHSRVHDLLAWIDPEWQVPFDHRRGGCANDHCGEPARRSGLCTRHELKLRYDVKRPRRSPGVMTIPCLECGRRLERLTNHVKAEHGMSKSDYLAAHPGAPLVSPVAISPVWREDRQGGRGIADRLEEVLTTLDDRSWAVIRDHLLADAKDTYETIGRRFGLTGARMKQIETTALRTVVGAIGREPVLRKVASNMAHPDQGVRPVSEIILEIPGIDATVTPVAKPAWWVLGRFAETYDIVDRWCGTPTVAAMKAHTIEALTELADANGAARLPAAGVDGFGGGSRPTWLDEWLDYCGYVVRGEDVWPKTGKVSDEIAMVLANASSPLTVHEVRDQLITSPSLTTVRNRLSDDPRFRPVGRGVWTLAAN